MIYKTRDRRVALNGILSELQIPHQSPQTQHNRSLNHPATSEPSSLQGVHIMAESTSQVQQPAASPSPPPPAPIPQTPGPRASRLHQVFDQALARTLRANSYQNFASCFPTPARHVPASLEGVWRQLNAKLEANAKAEFEDIVAERDAIPHLNELDRLVNDAKARKEQEAEHSEPQEHVVYVECVLNLDCYLCFIWAWKLICRNCLARIHSVQKICTKRISRHSSKKRSQHSTTGFRLRMRKMQNSRRQFRRKDSRLSNCYHILDWLFRILKVLPLQPRSSAMSIIFVRTPCKWTKKRVLVLLCEIIVISGFCS